MQQSPRPTSWSLDELTVNGWYPVWTEPTADGDPWTVKLTFYWSEASLHSVTGRGATREAAMTEAEREANAWLKDRRTYQPRR